PAVAICWLSRILDAFLTDGIRLRGRRLALVWNLGMYVNVLIGGLIIRGAVDAGVSEQSAGFALVVLGAISIAMVINFVLAATWIRANGGPPISKQGRTNFLPQPPWITPPNLLSPTPRGASLPAPPGS